MEQQRPSDGLRDLDNEVESLLSLAPRIDSRLMDGRVSSDESVKANQTITSAISALYRLGGGDVGAAETSDVIKVLTEAGVKRVSGIEEVDPEAISGKAGTELRPGQRSDEMEQQKLSDAFRDLRNEVESLPASLRSLTSRQSLATLSLMKDDDLNRPETEEDGIRAEAIRRLKVHHLFKGRQVQTKDSSPLPSDMPQPTESTSVPDQVNSASRREV